MQPNRDHLRILIAEDDEDDLLLLNRAFREMNFNNPVDTVSNGEQLLHHLRTHTPLPAFVLLDLNMPVKDGRETLIELRADETLRHLPVIIMSTSSAPHEINTLYRLGANSFITKPTTFHDLVNILQTCVTYWLQVVQLPGHP
ncbi:MAG: response regulator [Chloroflexota bacterium]